MHDLSKLRKQHIIDYNCTGLCNNDKLNGKKIVKILKHKKLDKETLNDCLTMCYVILQKKNWCYTSLFPGKYQDRATNLKLFRNVRQIEGKVG